MTVIQIFLKNALRGYIELWMHAKSLESMREVLL